MLPYIAVTIYTKYVCIYKCMYAFKKSRQAAITTTITTIDEAKQGKKNAFMQRVQKKKHKCPLCGETPLPSKDST